MGDRAQQVDAEPLYVLARLSPDRTAGQLPIWNRTGRVDGSVSVAFKTVDVDRAAGFVWQSVDESRSRKIRRPIYSDRKIRTVSRCSRTEPGWVPDV